IYKVFEAYENDNNGTKVLQFNSLHLGNNTCSFYGATNINLLDKDKVKNKSTLEHYEYKLFLSNDEAICLLIQIHDEYGVDTTGKKIIATIKTFIPPFDI